MNAYLRRRGEVVANSFRMLPLNLVLVANEVKVGMKVKLSLCFN
jgi:hypothetical protein